MNRLAGRFGYVSLNQVQERWWPVLSTMTASGKAVTPDSAIRVSAVMACVRVLAETMASFPVHIYRNLESSDKERVDDHPLNNVLRGTPNKRQTRFEWREMMMGHICLRGNAFSEIRYNPDMTVRELWPLHPDRVRIEVLSDESLIYIVKNPVTQAERRIVQDDMLHLRGLSSDGYSGLSPIKCHAQAIGVALAADEFSASFFKNNMALGNVLMHPGTLGDKAYRRLKAEMETEFGGSENAYKTYVFEEGIKWESLGVKPEEGQFIETRKFSVSDIARIFRVPPHLIGDLDKATFSNIEHQSIDFAQFSMLPWCQRWETAIERDLFTEEDKENGVYVQFEMDGILRGDAKSRSEALQIQFRNGIINQDEWRRLENRNSLPNGEGKKFYVPLELAPTEQAGTARKPAKKKEQQTFEGESLKAWLSDIAKRLLSAESKAITEKKDIFSFLKRHSKYAEECVGPICHYLKKDLAKVVSMTICLSFQQGFEDTKGSQERQDQWMGSERLKNIFTILNSYLLENKS